MKVCTTRSQSVHLEVDEQSNFIPMVTKRVAENAKQKNNRFNQPRCESTLNVNCRASWNQKRITNTKVFCKIVKSKNIAVNWGANPVQGEGLLCANQRNLFSTSLNSSCYHDDYKLKNTETTWFLYLRCLYTNESSHGESVPICIVSVASDVGKLLLEETLHVKADIEAVLGLGVFAPECIVDFCCQCPSVIH